MADYKFTRKAVEDLNNIWEYTLENWSEEQADKYYTMLIRICEDIANNSDLGKNYKEIIPNLFGVRAGRHIIFYRKRIDKNIEITRILHERMDLKNKLTE